MNSRLLSYLCGSVGVFAIRFLYFLALTFFLNTQELADFTTSISISAILLSVCMYGNYNLFMRRTAQGEGSDLVLGEYIITSFFYFSFFLIILLMLRFNYNQFMGVSTNRLIYIYFAEFFFTAIPALFKAYALTEYDRNILVDSLVNINVALLLLASVTLLYFYDSKDYYSVWIKVYASVGLLSFIIRLLIWRKNIHYPNIKHYIPAVINQFHNGHGFMISTVFRNIYLNIDKILMLNILGGEIAGNYAIAFRFYNVFLMVLNSVSGVKEAKLYQLAEESLHALNKEVASINRMTLKYFIMVIPFWLLASFGVYIYYPEQCAYMLILLLLLCPVQLLSFTMLNVLNSSGFEWQRLLYMFIGALISAVTSFLLSGLMSWVAIIAGAILSSSAVLVLSKNIFMKKVSDV
ncbi:lipopolysaccharide biosynthesis protein [Escherichia coli]